YCSFTSTTHLIYPLSFPTRRSSDLSPIRVCSFSRSSSAAHAACHSSRVPIVWVVVVVFMIPFTSYAAIGSAATSAAFWRSSSFRSEEHTSELQSQSNLVCRLLLEKI